MANITIAESEYVKIEDYVELTSCEVAMMGYATMREGEVYVDEVFLVPQEVTGTSVDFLEKGLAFAVEKATKDDRVNDLKFCVHSHVNMGTFFSDTDHDMVKKVRDSGPIPWFASAVFNKKGSTYGRVDYFKPEGELAFIASHISVELDVVCEGHNVTDEEARIKELEKYLSKPKPKTWENKGRTVYPNDTKKSSKKGKKSKSRKAGEKTEPKPITFYDDLHHADYNGPITQRDIALHHEAKQKGWASYDADGVRYYWDEQANEFCGSATLPDEDDKRFQ